MLNSAVRNHLGLIAFPCVLRHQRGNAVHRKVSKSRNSSVRPAPDGVANVDSLLRIAPRVRQV